MSDYGHEPRFGTFITPHSQTPQASVELALLSERVGLDLVTFLDHPYQPALLDTWTLLSYIAAKTERVHLSGYVLNLPSRHPAFLARAAASLDLLSSGRVELGIGPGDTFALDAVAATGGPRRSASDALDALDEALDVIRGIWDVSTPSQLSVQGKHYDIPAALRGPQPAHDISIWVPAGGPRGRRLVGRKADGWISGGLWMADVEGELDRGNHFIDAAAAAAGRDPREVVRIFDFHGSVAGNGRSFVHGAPERWVEKLLPLAIEQGVSVFILVNDDPAAIATWGEDIAPALRSAVAAERRNTTKERVT